jgi:hypothetical protein
MNLHRTECLRRNNYYAANYEKANKKIIPNL